MNLQAFFSFRLSLKLHNTLICIRGHSSFPVPRSAPTPRSIAKFFANGASCGPERGPMEETLQNEQLPKGPRSLCVTFLQIRAFSWHFCTTTATAARSLSLSLSLSLSSSLEPTRCPGEHYKKKFTFAQKQRQLQQHQQLLEKCLPNMAQGIGPPRWERGLGLGGLNHNF